jgi:transposase
MSLPTVLPEADRSVLMVRVNRATATVREVLRARIILALSEHGVRETARQVGCAKSTVVKWRDRYRVEGLAGLRDRPRSGAPRIHSDAQRRAVAATATSQPPRPWGCWTHARLAERVNSQLAAAGPAATAGSGPVRPVSACWVGRVLREAHIRVHRVRGWLHRKPDPLFDARIAAIEAAVAAAGAGHSAVICLDEKTAVGVRTPCHRDSYGPDGRRRREFEYRRAGTLSWYGTQEATSGVIALRRARSRMDSAAFTTVLDDLLAAQGTDFTIIMDNGSTHTSAYTSRWLDAHPQVQVLFTPIHASWANPEEVVFSILTRQVLTGGHFTGGDDLDHAAQQWVALRNQHPLPVRWAHQKRVPRTSDAEH